MIDPEELFKELNRRTDSRRAGGYTHFHSTPNNNTSSFDEQMRKGNEDNGFKFEDLFTNNYTFSKPAFDITPMRDIYEDWGRHCNEASGKMFFVNLINKICENLRKRGLYVLLKEHDDEVAILMVSHDSPGAKEHAFVLKNEDNKHYSWRSFGSPYTRGYY